MTTNTLAIHFQVHWQSFKLFAISALLTWNNITIAHFDQKQKNEFIMYTNDSMVPCKHTGLTVSLHSIKRYTKGDII